MVPENIHPPTEGIGERSQRPKSLQVKQCMKLNWNIPEGWVRGQGQTPSIWGVLIFSGITRYKELPSVCEIWVFIRVRKESHLKQKCKV